MNSEKNVLRLNFAVFKNHYIMTTNDISGVTGVIGVRREKQWSAPSSIFLWGGGARGLKVKCCALK